MKKILLTLLLVSALCGCSASETPISTSGSVTPTVTPTPTPESIESEINTEIVVIDNEYVTFTIKGIYHEDDWGETIVKAFIENKTDTDIMVSWDEVSVNGFMCDPFWASEIAAGKKSNEKIAFYDTQLEENDIEFIENITFTLSAYHWTEDWDTINYVDEVEFTYTVK